VTDTQGTLSQTRTYAYGSNWKSETFNGRTTRRTFNRWGDVVSVTTPQDTVTYHYYSSRLPSSVTSCGHTVTMEYDIAGNRTSMTDPDAGTMTYTYDGLGRIKSQKDARNQTVTYTYDSYGRVQSGPVGGTPLVSNTYGTDSSYKGLLLSASVGTTCQAFYTYDGYGRITAKRCVLPTEDNRTFSYTYNADGLLASKTYPEAPRQPSSMMHTATMCLQLSAAPSYGSCPVPQAPPRSISWPMHSRWKRPATPSGCRRQRR